MVQLSNGTHSDGNAKAAKSTVSKRRRRPPVYEAVHTSSRTSLLSSEYEEVVNFRGLVNYLALFLVVSNLPRMCRNFEMYGNVVYNFAIGFMTVKSSSLGLIELSWTVILACDVAGFLIAWAEEAQDTHTRRRFGLLWDLLHITNVGAALCVPSFILLCSHGGYVVCLLTELWCLITHMKLWSFGHYLHGIRNRKSSDTNAKEIRHQLTLSNYLYFMSAPTVCYQASYPRDTAPIRTQFVLRRIGELIFCEGLVVLIFGQYITPVVTFRTEAELESAWEPFNLLILLLRVAVPYSMVFFLQFYALFHSFLNLLAELLRFPDRLFYRDWWNSKDLGEFWRKWNMPVHTWIIRHVHQPLSDAKVWPTLSLALSFLYSAILHEIVVDSVIHFIPERPYGFLAMFVQIPLIVGTQLLARSRLLNENYLNAVFWVAFNVFGQPLTILMYAQNYSKVHLIGASVEQGQ